MAGNRFPRTAKYDPDWVRRHSLGENVLYNLESLTEVMALERDARVLDLGCGRAVSSIFLAREYGVQVWALDHGEDPTANFRRAREMGCADRVYPMRLDARSLPFPEAWFDAALAVDAWHYFGTDERYLPYLCRFLRPGGTLGVVDACLAREIARPEEAPAYMRAEWERYWFPFHTPEWWRAMWEKTGLVEVLRCEELPETAWIWDRFVEDYGSDGGAGGEIDRTLADAVARDREGERLLRLFRMVARRTERDPPLEDHETPG